MLKQYLSIYTEKAKELMSEDGLVEDVLHSAEEKIAYIPGVGGQASRLLLMMSMIRAYVAGEYRDVPPKTVASMLGAFLYLISPADFVPDHIPVLGFADDLALLTFILTLNKKELDEYEAWRGNKADIIDVEVK